MPGYTARIAASGTALIGQIQRMDHAAEAIEAGAAVIVAQGAEAGGHSMDSLNGHAALNFLPELADWFSANVPETLLLAAGGTTDGRTGVGRR